ncbi:unnamed protein product, partial [Ilex paraguariensis]
MSGELGTGSNVLVLVLPPAESLDLVLHTNSVHDVPGFYFLAEKLLPSTCTTF